MVTPYPIFILFIKEKIEQIVRKRVTKNIWGWETNGILLKEKQENVRI